MAHEGDSPQQVRRSNRAPLYWALAVAAFLIVKFGSPYFHSPNTSSSGAAKAAGTPTVSPTTLAAPIAAKPEDKKPDETQESLTAQPASVSQPSAPIQTAEAVTGRVWIDETNAPAPQAFVSAFDAKDRIAKIVAANPDGEFRIEGLIPGAYRFAAKQGALISHLDSSRVASIALAPGKSIAPLELRLKPGFAFLVNVTRKSDGAPVPNAPVALGAYNGNAARATPPILIPAAYVSDSPYEARTDERGQRRFEGMPSGEIYVGIAAPGYASVSQFASTARGESRNRLDFQLEAGADARVKVVDGKGSPVAGATIAVNEAYWRPVVWGEGLHTGGDGELLLEGMPLSGGVGIEATKPGYARRRASTPRLAEGQKRFDVVIALDAEPAGSQGVFEGAVVDEAGAPIAGATVYYTEDPSWDVPRGANATTGADGAFRMIVGSMFDSPFGGSPDRRVLLARAEGWAAGSQALAPGTEAKPAKARIVLKRGRWLEAQVVDASGRAISDANLRIVQGMPAPGVYGGELGRGVTGSDGVVRIEHMLGEDPHAHVYAQGFRTQEKAPLAYEVRTRIVMTAENVVRGRVIDADTRQPIESFAVFFGEEDDADFSYTMREQHPGGEFENSSPEDVSKVGVRAEGYTLLRASDLPAESTSAAPKKLFEMTRRKTFSLRVTTPDGQPVRGAKVLYASDAMGMGIIGSDPFQSLERYAQTQVAVTGAGGQCEFFEKRPEGTLVVDAPGYALTVRTSKLVRENKSANGGAVVVALNPPGSIGGSVIAQGKPLPGEIVQLGGPPFMEGNRLQRRAVTDPNGVYLFERVDGGDYMLNGRFNFDSDPVRATVALAVGESKLVDLVAAPTELKITGLVYDTTAQPLAGVKVGLTTSMGFRNLNKSALTGADGRYEFAGLSEGSYQLSAAKTEEDGTAVEFESPARVTLKENATHDFKALARFQLRGSIAFEANTPQDIRNNIASVRIAAYPRGRNMGTFFGTADAPLDSGRFSVSGRFREQYTVSALYRLTPERITEVELTRITATENANIDVGELIVPALGWFRLNLIYPEGDPVRAQDTQVLLQTTKPDGPRPPSFNLKPEESSVLLGPIPPGRVYATVRASGFKTDPERGAFEIPVGGEATHEVRMTPHGILRGSVEEALPRSSGITMGFGSRTAIAYEVTLKGAGIERVLRKPAPGERMVQPTAENPFPDSVSSYGFVFQNLPGGRYDLTIVWEGHKTFTGSYDVVPGVPQSQSFRLQPDEDAVEP